MELLMPFIDQSPSFCHGFEIGELWSVMKSGQTISSRMFHRANTDQIKMIGQHFGYKIEITNVDECWILINAHQPVCNFKHAHLN